MPYEISYGFPIMSTLSHGQCCSLVVVTSVPSIFQRPYTGCPSGRHMKDSYGTLPASIHIVRETFKLLAYFSSRYGHVIKIKMRKCKIRHEQNLLTIKFRCHWTSLTLILQLILTGDKKINNCGVNIDNTTMFLTNSSKDLALTTLLVMMKT